MNVTPCEVENVAQAQTKGLVPIQTGRQSRHRSLGWLQSLGLGLVYGSAHDLA
jgi:hypothetical protein